MQNILRESALFFLELEIVLVFRKILGHGNEFVADVIPSFEGFVCTGARRARSLALGLREAAGGGHAGDE
jgi:hypothetical protein